MVNHYSIATSTIPQLSYKTVHIWRLTLPLSEKMIEVLKSVLSPDETARAKNFRFKTHQDQFIASRGGLRKILSYYLNIFPQNIRFLYTSYGKPYLNSTDLTFNTSHSGKFIVYALTRKTCIGIDIEELNLDLDFLSLAKTIFSKEEYARFLRIPSKEKPIAFYRSWTRKEAYLKAIGTGLYYPFNQIQVSFSASEEPRLLSIQSDPFEHNLWQLKEIILNQDCITTIATRQKYKHLYIWDWHRVFK